jgi:hypothetical protein
MTHWPAGAGKTGFGGPIFRSADLETKGRYAPLVSAEKAENTANSTDL